MYVLELQEHCSSPAIISWFGPQILLRKKKKVNVGLRGLFKPGEDISLFESGLARLGQTCQRTRDRRY